MKIGIHHKENSFSEYWVEYCKKNNIDYKIVNAYDSDIISQLDDCDAFMWHHSHVVTKDTLFAKQLLTAIQLSGKVTFPDIDTGWHFDDKVAQKYLFESRGAPLVPSYVFYNKEAAVKWAENTEFPKVFKLRGGAGATNVYLLHTRKEALRFIAKAFGKGFATADRYNELKDRCTRFRKGKASIIHVLKGIVRLVYTPSSDKRYHKEGGYAYFQDFMPNQEYDTRIIVINGNKAFGEKRFVRKNDFRASGSGEFSYNDIDPRIVKTAFDVAKRLKLQSVAFDFIYDENKNPLIVEISYAFGTKGACNCPGYWSDDMQWHEGGKFDFYGWMIEGVLEKIQQKKNAATR